MTTIKVVSGIDCCKQCGWAVNGGKNLELREKQGHTPKTQKIIKDGPSNPCGTQRATAAKAQISANTLFKNPKTLVLSFGGQAGVRASLVAGVDEVCRRFLTRKVSEKLSKIVLCTK